jgi:hypothetical protein
VPTRDRHSHPYPTFRVVFGTSLTTAAALAHEPGDLRPVPAFRPRISGAFGFTGVPAHRARGEEEARELPGFFAFRSRITAARTVVVHWQPFR